MNEYAISIYANNGEKVVQGTFEATKEQMSQFLDVLFESNMTAVVRMENDEVQQG